MTEKQIETLKGLLASSSEIDCSSELDEKILTAARARALQNTRVRFMLADYIPFGFLGAAVFSVILTFGMLFGMSEILEVNNSLAPASKESSVAIHIQGTPPFESEMPLPNTKLSRLNDIKQPGMAQARDLILADMELPDTQTLLAGMEFSFSSDRALAENTIDTAMSEIGQMIRGGELDGARERYAQLRLSCDVCTLPDTLEALVLNGPAETDSG